MSQCINKSIHLIRYMCCKHANDKLVVAIIKKADKDLIDSFTEIAFNLVRKIVPFNPGRLKKFYENLASKHFTASWKKRALIRYKKFWKEPIGKALEILELL